MSRQSCSDELSTATTENRNLINGILGRRVFLSLRIATSGDSTLYVFNGDQDIEKYLGYEIYEHLEVHNVQIAYNAFERQQKSHLWKPEDQKRWNC
jgi:hypothetical protein